ncbi:MAG: hypothetical protein IT328_13665 [Caldilineaceae bacterium]|nr:hypothetical protein [Caldilineaceae bacterium]
MMLPNTVTAKTCPQCGHKGRAVDTQVVKAMLRGSLHAIRPASYHFCQTEQCPVVYFAEDGQQFFVEDELRERVYQKHTQEEDVLICYCFRHTPGSIRDEWRQTGQSSVIETITAGTQAGACACDIRNPQATCCLGNVRQFVQQMQREP